ncbi:DUF262 domain-containing protein [Leptospira sp. B5-022]|uniref:GmrSD restriction endonuclease domain-containing protein n=1 Tax=Leptospira sp. B5-022 TaxID=1242992 RepID=UPI0002BF1189|nr:DUF262 domain-containing protein [Leptospira sp. B5-022]EMJ99590.1 PF03235 family protein [Leptospira sp. B5-022]
MNLPEPHGTPYSSLINDIERGQVKIPQFQREFVWEISKVVNLLDSIIKGYPIGTFIFWRTNDRLRAIRNIGNVELPEAGDGEYVNYVLDGQQRLTSLYCSLRGITIVRESKKLEDFSKIYIDLDSNEDDKIVKTSQEILEVNDRVITINQLLTGGLSLLSGYPSQYHHKLEEYKKRLESYSYSIILIKEVNISVATEIFSRINEGGKTLTLFEIMVAKTYDLPSGFDLSEKFKLLIQELQEVGYETISDVTVLQIISIILRKECRRKDILTITRHEFIPAWDKAVDSLKRAIDYFRTFYRIPVSQLLPYNALLVSFSYFFYHHQTRPTGETERKLQDFFWRCSLSGRYSSGLETKLAQDIKRMDAVLQNDHVTYSWPVKITSEYIKGNGWFSTGRSFIKAILCVYSYYEPKSFDNDGKVIIDNAWLKISSSKNYHHFFPKAFLERSGIENSKANNILNITIVDDYLNKRKIRDKAPANYMTEFSKSNPKLEETLKSHLITDMYEFGIWENDYEKFITKRADAVVQHFQEILIPQEIDAIDMPVIEDDEEELM